MYIQYGTCAGDGQIPPPKKVSAILVIEKKDIRNTEINQCKKINH